MKVFIVGANGQIGRQLVQKLQERQDQVTAGVRKPAEQALVKSENVNYVHFDLNWTIEKMAETFKDQDIVIFAAGSRGEDLLKIDLDGAIKTMKAAEKNNIKRYQLVSTVNADDRQAWPGDLHDYFIAKHYADEWLSHRTNLDYVIIRPVQLTNDKGSNQVQVSLNGKLGLDHQVSRENVAGVMAELVHRPEINKAEISIADGQTDLTKAVNQLSSKEWKL